MLFIFMCMDVLPTYVSMHMIPEEARRGCVFELQKVVSLQMGSGNRTWDLEEPSILSATEHLSSPHLGNLCFVVLSSFVLFSTFIGYCHIDTRATSFCPVLTMGQASPGAPPPPELPLQPSKVSFCCCSNCSSRS